jgi:hypothetical protein
MNGSVAALCPLKCSLRNRCHRVHKRLRQAVLLAAGAAAVAMAAAPTAAAAIAQTCSGNICRSPGNVQINNTPPPVQYYPYGTMPFLLGGHGGGLLGGLF